MAQTLPRGDSSLQSIFALDNASLDAYDVCIELEDKASDEEELRNARLLGYLILYAPSSAARYEIVKTIHSCSGEKEDLQELSTLYMDFFVRLRRKCKGGTPISQGHRVRSPPLFDENRVNLLATIKESPRDHAEAKRQAMIRDNYRCVVTGRYDVSAASLATAEDDRVGHNQCAHILPALESTTYVNDVQPILPVLKIFGYDAEALNGTKVHSLWNVMTMAADPHDFFDRLELWFEPKDIVQRDKHIYTVHCIIPKSGMPDRITLTTPDPDLLPLPHPVMLVLHPTCAKVAHLSGAGEYINKIVDDMETLDVLADDGSSKDLLYHAVFLAQLVSAEGV